MSRSTTATTLFDTAARTFEGWTDPTTGNRVLKLVPKNLEWTPGQLHTLYHQHPCFLEGGRKVLLRSGNWYAGWGGIPTYAIDLATGEATMPWPEPDDLVEVHDGVQRGLVIRPGEMGGDMVLVDLTTKQDLAKLPNEGWNIGGLFMLSDGSGAIASVFRGKRYVEPVWCRLYLLRPGSEPQILAEEDRAAMNHMQSNPADPNLFSYDHWPSPKQPKPQIITLMTLDGTMREPLKLDPNVPLPGSIWGGQRDHYVWTPDGKYIGSYFSPRDMEVDESNLNHFSFGWWISFTNWQTGEDLAAEYPENRWGCHFNCTRDSKYAITAGGPGFDWLYAVNIEGLRDGWNETLICAYPKTVSVGHNQEPFAFPHVLPDNSGVIFEAGWPGDEQAVYMAELRLP